MVQDRLSQFQAALTESYDLMFSTRHNFQDDQTESGFANLGYFLPDTPSYTAACENLMERLLGLLRRRHGPVLDVGCGLGGAAKVLTRHYPCAEVHGINISVYQLGVCRRRVPGSHFHLMAAERLGFSEDTFGAVVSVEAAPHFKGRREFLREACRVLRPGGELVVADVLFHAQPRSFRKVLADQELYRDIGEYRALWNACGLRDVTCEDVTGPCLRGYVEHAKRWALHDRLTGRIDGLVFQHRLHFARKLAELPVTAYVFAHAWKPA
jgi:MPBQ/MSBQ methyltransferase